MNPLLYPSATGQMTNQLLTRRPVTEEARRTALSQALQEKMRSDPRYDQISAMREQSMTPFGVGAGWTGVAAQLANALAANVSEKRLNKDYQGQQEAKNAQMAQLLELYSPAPVEGAGNGPAGMDGAQQQRIASALDQPDNSGFSINAQRDADPKRAALAALLANPDMQDAAGGMILKSAFDPKEKTKYETVEGPDGTYAYDPTNPSAKPIKISDGKPKALPGDVEEYKFAMEQLPPDAPKPTYTDWTRENKRAGASRNSSTTIVDMGNKQGEKFNEAMGKGMGEMYSKAVERQLAAPGTMARYDRMEELLATAPTGKVAEMTLPARQFLNSMGIGDERTIASQEEFRSLTASAALDETAKLPGVASDRDTMLIMDAKPALGKSETGNRLMAKFAKAGLKRDMQTPQVMEQYINQSPNKSLDAGWPQYYAEWAAKNPLLTPEDRAAVETLMGTRKATPNAATATTRYRYGSMGERLD